MLKGHKKVNNNMAASSETCFDGGMLSHNNVKNAGVSTRYIDDVKVHKLQVQREASVVLPMAIVC